MRDEETGTYWQQISGPAISGPLRGHAAHAGSGRRTDFATWKSEQPGGTVLNDVPGFTPNTRLKTGTARWTKYPP